MYGFSETFVKWFKSYLTEKILFVSLENVFSNAATTVCGPLDLSKFVTEIEIVLSCPLNSARIRQNMFHSV